MHNELTNLLPIERQRALGREYVIRVLVIAVVFVNLLVLAAAALLLPTYTLLTDSARTKKEHLANIESTFASTNEAVISARLAALSDKVTMLTALAQLPSASGVIRSILEVPRPGIVLSSFSYSPKSDGGIGSVQVSGIAKTRDTLRSYQLALSEASFAQSANLPVSAYAKDSDIGFSISVALAP
ncbi:MAG: hypothetical protein Q7T37_01535 [bacterium]|nr:hypothetical protein [bacterium]MDO8742313.1 hypothetical protein [bacterium]